MPYSLANKASQVRCGASMLRCWFTLATLLLPPTSVSALETKIALTQPTACGADQFFNTASLRCSSCNGGSRTRSGDGLKCACLNGYTEADYGSPLVNCTPCSATVSFDRRLCLKCLSSSCSCGANNVREENIAGRTAACISCPSNTVPNAAGNECVLCQQTFTDYNNTVCQCGTSNSGTVSGGLCLQSVADIKTELTLWEKTFLKSAYSACKDYKNATACQLLTNMVIMKAFTLDSDAYTLYTGISQSTPRNKFLPSLYHPNSGNLGSAAPTSLSFQRGSLIKLKIVKYDTRGNFLGWEDVTGGTLQLCPDTQSSLDAAYIFGTSYNQLCTMQVSDLLQRVPEPVFYQLFLQYTDSSGNIMLWPIPVQNMNIQSGKQALLRFFLVDGLSGRTGNLANPPTTVTIATSIVLSLVPSARYVFYSVVNNLWQLVCLRKYSVERLDMSNIYINHLVHQCQSIS